MSIAGDSGAHPAGTVEVIVPYETGGPRALHVDGKFVYWGAGRQIRRMSKRGGPVEELGPYSGRTTTLALIQTDEQNVYWLDADGIHVRSHDGAVSRVLPTAGMDVTFGGDYLVDGAVAIFTDSGCRTIGLAPLDGTQPRLIDGPRHPDAGGVTTLTADSDSIYCSRPDRILRVGKDTATVEELLVHEKRAGAFTADDKHLFWTTSLPTLPVEVARVAKAGGSAELLYVSAERGDPGVLHLDPQRRTLYWTTGITYNAGVYSYALDSGVFAKLAAERRTNGGFAGDDEYLYWTEHQGIVRMRKPD